MKVFAGVVILFDQNRHHWAEGLWEVLVERLLLGSPVLSLEHIFKLRKGVDPGKIALSRPFIELGDRFINSEFNQVLTAILMDSKAT